MKRIDRIKNMSVSDMAKAMEDLGLDPCKFCPYDTKPCEFCTGKFSGKEIFEKWLQLEE